MSVHQMVRMAMLLVIWAECFLLLSHGAWGTTEVRQVLIPKNDSHDPIPCVGLQRGEIPSLLYWFIGETWETAENSRVVKYSDPSIGQNETMNVRYSLSHGFGLIIRNIKTTDSGRYWCRVIRAVANKESIQAVDVTVLVRDLLPGPVIWLESPENPVSKVSVFKHQILKCSVNNVYPSPDLTWSFIGCRDTDNQPIELFTSNEQTSYDQLSEIYHVTKKAYFGALGLKRDNCQFECVAKGLAINNGSSSTVVELIVTAQQPGNDGPGAKSPNTTFIGAIIILALILVICFIAFVYFMRRVYLPQRRTIKANVYEMEQPTGTPDEKTGLLMEHSSTEKTNITGYGRTQWSSRGVLKGHKDILDKDDETKGDICGVIGDSQGLLLATRKFVIRYPNSSKSEPRIATTDKFAGNVISIAIDPQSERLIVGLKKSEKTPVEKVKATIVKKKQDFRNSSMIFFDMKSGGHVDYDESNKFTNPKVTVDGAGAIFVGELDSKTIHVFESQSKMHVEYTLDIDMLRNIAAYGWKHLFVSNGKNTIKKYNFRRKDSCLNVFGAKDCIKINPAKDKLGEIIVHNDRLYVVDDDRIVAFDVEVFEKLHTFETGFPNLQGLCFFGKSMSDVALYSTECVKIYKVEKTKKESGNAGAIV